MGQGDLLGRSASPNLLLAALLDTGGAAPGSGTQPNSDTLQGSGDICYIVDTIAHFSTYCSTYNFLRLHPIWSAGAGHVLDSFCSRKRDVLCPLVAPRSWAGA